MGHAEDEQLMAVRERAYRRRGSLAADLVDAAQDDKEAILAEMDFDAWLANACDECLEASEQPYI